MISRIKTAAGFVAMVIGLSSAVPMTQAASLVAYQFPNGGSPLYPISFAPTTLASNLNAGNVSTGSGVVPITNLIAVDYLSVQESTPGTTTLPLAVTRSSFFQFTVTPDSSYHLDLTSLTFNAAKSIGMLSGVNAGYAVRSSLDGFTGNLGTGTLTSTSFGAQSISLGAPFQGITSALTFRFYVYAADRIPLTLQGGSNYDNIVLQGSVSSVPEPASLMMGAIGIIGVGCLGYRKRIIKKSA